ncbi:MAG: diguanylate cyclase [Firmicutes bacterium]|nr:diguanylate cyclase [Bacillota bacterium]
MKESKEAVKAFFDDIHTGVPSGEVKVHVKMPDGQLAWSQCKYSTIFAGGKPVTALISVEDITEAYMHQLSHLRFEQANNENKGDYVGFLQADLTLDYVEKHKSVYATSISFEGATFTEYSENGFGAFDDEHREAASKFYTREKLIDDFNNGVNRLENIWHTSSGKWIKYTADLLRDPISGHIKIFAGTKDITDEYEAQLAITRRADYDAMTGLYRVDVGQSLIKEAINTEGGKGGILISLDLDDLKKINDTFGHDAGNDAITSIASIMKEHFRIDDIIVRAGGDEFIIYLRDAATRSDAVSVSMTSLLQKLSRVFVGKDKDYGIHCSAGCAVEEKGDTYDTLFKRADTALYHVKRNGKNNFAFYEPAMEEENYEFQTQRIMSMGSDQRFNIKEVHLLLESIKVFYDLVLNIDISDNSYFIMGEVDDGVFAKVPTFGRLTDFIGMCEKGLHPDDLDGFMSKLSRDSLIKLYGQGHEKIHTQFRFINNGQYSWAESMTMFYVNDTGNVCNFTLIKWADERVSDLEQLRRQKIMDMSLTANLEYVVVIDVDTGAYSILSRDDRDSHRMPDSGDFKEATAIVCENCISQENWQEYYEGMSIKNVLAEIEASGKDYKYEYVMSDGTLSEAVFTWYEESHCELLMTIRKKTVG